MRPFGRQIRSSLLSTAESPTSLGRKTIAGGQLPRFLLVALRQTRLPSTVAMELGRLRSGGRLRRARKGHDAQTPATQENQPVTATTARSRPTAYRWNRSIVIVFARSTRGESREQSTTHPSPRGRKLTKLKKPADASRLSRSPISNSKKRRLCHVHHD